MAERDDEFYVGYLPEAPPGIAARARLSAALLLAIGLAVGLLLVSRQQRFDAGVFEYGVSTRVEGVVQERPHPVLYVERPGVGPAGGAFSRYELVAYGKRGAGQLVAGLDGRSVRLSGSLIYWQGRTMVEIEAGTVEPLNDAALEARVRQWQAPPEDLGERTLVGEIIDSKCFMGVMKPGRLKPHKACAIRCISGGIPPMLRVEDESGRAELFLLVGADGRAINHEVLGFVAEPVEICGRLKRHADFYVLEAEPDTYRRR